MGNILILYEILEPCSIEIIRMFRLLETDGAVLFRERSVWCLKAEDICWCDVIVSVRSTSFFEWGLAKYANSIGKYWILMLDDDFLGLSNDYGKDGEGYWAVRQFYLKRMLQYVNCLLVVNENLAEKYIGFCQTKKYVITNTIIEQSELAAVENNELNDKVKIVLYVNDGTLDMFNIIIKPVIHILSDRYSGKIALYFLGLKPDLEEYRGQVDIRYIPHMLYSDFKKYMVNEHFDIGLAPLNDCGFSIYKYFNKYVEYTIAGIPGIYSNCRLYQKVITNGHNGLLCNNTPNEWYDSIKKYIESCCFRKKCIKNAQKHIYDNFNSDTVLNKLIINIPELTSYRSPKVSFIKTYIILNLIKVGYCLFRILGWGRTFFIYIKIGNYRGLKNRLKEKILLRK